MDKKTNEGLEKFRELLLTDEAFQEKLKTAAENYEGEKTEEAAFHGVVEPIASEYGITATFDEYSEYIRMISMDSELSADELKQVAGGKINGGGLGVIECKIVGFGAGVGGGAEGGGACVVIGVGSGSAACVTAGTTVDTN